MAEADRYMFDHKELAEVLVRAQGVSKGLWGIAVEFGLAAANVPTTPDGKSLSPAAINLVQKIGIQRFPEANNLTVDAAELRSKDRKPAKIRAKSQLTKVKRKGA